MHFIKSYTVSETMEPILLLGTAWILCLKSNYVPRWMLKLQHFHLHFIQQEEYKKPVVSNYKNMS